jgi:hypothetical protein
VTRPATRRQVFRGAIAGVGTDEGTRVVVGHWPESPWGAFTDAMVQRPDGHRVLLAPHDEAVGFVAATYRFDETRMEPVELATTERSWRLRAASLTLDLDLGGRTALGRLLRLVPRRVAEAPAWCAVTDPVARTFLTGVRTRGDTGDRREWYGATDHRRVVGLAGRFDGVDLGGLRPVEPPTTFGFSSTPPRPSVTSVATTVELPLER